MNADDHCLLLEVEAALRIAAGFRTPLGFLALRNEIEEIAERYRALAENPSLDEGAELRDYLQGV